MGPGGPSAHEIVVITKPKEGHTYPLWQQPMFVFVLITNLHGTCRFQVELRLDELDADTLVQATSELSLEFGNDPLRMQPISVMIKSARLPRAGVYRLNMVSNGTTLATATIHAR